VSYLLKFVALVLRSFGKGDVRTPAAPPPVDWRGQQSSATYPKPRGADPYSTLSDRDLPRVTCRPSSRQPA
jgi:hypothetical protein